MAITLLGTNGLVASGNEKVADASLVVTFTAATQVGDRLFLAVSADNLSLTTPTVSSTVDSRGNTWTAVAGAAPNASSATAAAAVVLRILECKVTVAHQVNDTVTITLSGTVTAKAGMVKGLRGVDASAVTGVVASQGTTGSPAFNVTPGASGDAVVGFLATENNAVAAGDTDTLNGSWSTAVGVATSGGSGVTNAAVTAQTKVVTATGAQTWTATGTADWAAVAFAVKAAKIVVVNQINSATFALPLATRIRANQAQESDFAQTITRVSPAQFIPVAQVSQTNVAQPIRAIKSRVIGQAGSSGGGTGTNYFTGDNAGFESGVGAWGPWFGASAARSTLEARSGTASYEVLINAQFWGIIMQNSPGFAASPGLARIGFSIKRASGSTVTVVDATFKAFGAFNGTEYPVLGEWVVNGLASDAWQDYALDVTFPAGTTWAFCQVAGNNAIAGDVVYFDDFYAGTRPATANNIANPIKPIKSRTLAQTVEADASRPLGGVASTPVAQVVSTNIANPVARLRTKQVGLVTQPSLSQPITRNKKKILGQAGLSATSVTDSFNRANSTTTMGATDTGQVWSYPQGTWGISNNQAYSVSGVNNDTALVETGNSDQTVRMTVGAYDGGNFFGIVARATDQNNGYLADTNGATVRLFACVGGAYTDLFTGGHGYTGVAGDVLELSVIGSMVTVRLNGLTVMQKTDTSIVSGSKAGKRSGATSIARWDNFTVSENRTNYAAGKPAIASTEFDATFLAGNATDNNTGTRWSSALSGTAVNHTIYVDLQSPRILNEVVIHWDSSHGIDYKIQSSDDASTWTDRATITGGNGAVDASTIPNIASRYWRMSQTLGINANSSIREFRCMGAGSAAVSESALPVIGKKSRLLGQPVSANTAQTIATTNAKVVAQVSETSLAQPVARRKVKATAQTVEADSSLAIVRAKRKALAQSLEADTARRILLPILVRQALEADTATAISTRRLRALLQTFETDLAQAVARRRSRLLAQVSETDTTTAIARRKVKATAQTSEADVAQALTRRKVRVLGQVVESDAPQAIQKSKKRAVATSLEADTTFRVGHRRSVGQAAESDSAQTVTRTKRRATGQTLEADSTTALVKRKSRAVQSVTETDLTFLVARRKQRTTSQVSELDAAQTILRKRVRAVLQTSTTSLAQPVARTKRRTPQQSVEFQTSQPILRGGYGSAIGMAAEADTARPIVRAPFTVVGKVVEVDSSTAATRRKSKVLGQATESEIALAVARRFSRVIATVLETDSATGITRNRRRSLTQPVETDAARPVAHPKVKVLGQVVETDLAQTFTAGNNIPVSQPSETDSALSLSRGKSIPVGLVVEGSASLQVGRTKSRSTDRATESTTSQSVTTRKIRLVGLASDVSVAFSIDHDKKNAIGLAEEQDRTFVVFWPNALPVTPVPSLPVGVVLLASSPVSHTGLPSDAPGIVWIASAPVAPS